MNWTDNKHKNSYKVALKVYPRHGIRSEQKTKIYTEVNILKALDHPNVVGLYSIIH